MLIILSHRPITPFHMWKTSMYFSFDVYKSLTYSTRNLPRWKANKTKKNERKGKQHICNWNILKQFSHNFEQTEMETDGDGCGRSHRRRKEREWVNNNRIQSSSRCFQLIFILCEWKYILFESSCVSNTAHLVTVISRYNVFRSLPLWA